jgi:hypothetical protein
VKLKKPEWLKAVQKASVKRGTDKLTLKDINAEIEATRARRKRKADNAPGAGHEHRRLSTTQARN